MLDQNTIIPIDTLFPIIIHWAAVIGLFIFVIYSLFLVYHWFAYGTTTKTNQIATFVYFCVTIPLLVIMYIFLPTV